MRYDPDVGRLDTVGASVQPVARPLVFDAAVGHLSAVRGCGRRLRRGFRPRGLPARRHGGRRQRAAVVRGHRRAGDGAVRAAGRRGAASIGVRRFSERRDDERSGGRDGRRVRLDRARQALHHHGHGDRPGQDVEPECAGGGGGTDRAGDAGRRPDDVPPALHAGDVRRLRRAVSRGTCSRRCGCRRSQPPGAVLEDVGTWKRARCFPRAGETIDAAVVRECLAVRNDVGMLDASTLGKIEVVGPDAAAFLSRIYTGDFTTSGAGAVPLCRAAGRGWFHP